EEVRRRRDRDPLDGRAAAADPGGGADAAAGVLHRPAPRRGRRSAAESGEERDGGVKPRALFCHPERSEGPGGADGAQTHPPRPLATLGVTLPLHWSALLGF